MAEREVERWITVRGAHIPIYTDGSTGIGTKESVKVKNVDADGFFDKGRNMDAQVRDYEDNYVKDSNVSEAIRQYGYGVYGDENAKAKFDEEHGISNYIDSSQGMRLEGQFYRGVVLTDSELNALKVGGNANIKGLTSWSNREMVAHMYAQGDEYGYTMGGKQGNAVVFIDEKGSNAVPNPYTFPQDEVLRSNNVSYEVTKILSQKDYKAPIGRKGNDKQSEYYTAPVTYVYVKSKKKG